MSDLISRKAAIEALAEHEKSNGHNYTLFVDIVSECAEIIRDLPSAQEQRWIPVSKRVPEDGTEVVVSIHDDAGDTSFDYTTVGWHFKGEWIVNDERNYYVSAWMPLPEPYKGEI